ncbi:MAG: trypsin-like peptidase domain-containing protein [Oscillatoria sp. PMC 1068.18]|nr:trypsin-like peptidase domain-containing protein [Oscillatoria sp. PMC 1076.18]MEC4990383.1 trypsin-like peptidase domain-containing protein [Oscillatoria sp. PMC 1068.18]
MKRTLSAIALVLLLGVLGCDLSARDDSTALPPATNESEKIDLPDAELPPAMENMPEQAVQVYAKASPAVVTINVGRGTGSGSIVSSDGLVLTNQHVISTASNGRVVVTTAAEERYPGQVIAVDTVNDLALIRLNTDAELPTIALADSDNIQVGQTVYAIGSPFGLSGTFTTGILSRIDRNTGDLQTDAAINPGNSGGPLLNSRGELIGVNKAIVSSSGGNIGIGFASSVSVAESFIAANENRNAPVTAEIPSPAAPRLGATIDTTTFVIQEVEPGSPADNAGIRNGDRLVELNGSRIISVNALVAFLDTNPDAALLTIERNRAVREVQVKF